jgi:hypothetical protein
MKSYITLASIVVLATSTVLAAPTSEAGKILLSRQEPRRVAPSGTYIHKADDFIMLEFDDPGRIRHNNGSVDLSTIVIFDTSNMEHHDCSINFSYQSEDVLDSLKSFEVMVRTGSTLSLTKETWENDFSSTLFENKEGIWTVAANPGLATLIYGAAMTPGVATDAVKFPCRPSGDDFSQYLAVELVPFHTISDAGLINLKFKRDSMTDVGVLLKVYPLDL